jgi:hypothetical protein
MRKTVLAVGIWTATLVLACAGVASGENLIERLAKAPRVQPGPAPNFGTSKEIFFRVFESEFDPAASTLTYDDAAHGGMNAVRYATGGTTGFFGATHLPDGAVLTSITFDLCDSSASDAHWTIALVSCANVDGLCSLVGTLVNSVSNVITPCAAYTQDLSGLNYVIGNQSATLAITALPGADDITNGIAGATIGYKLQVSPAPGTATFGDVPTDHPFFQYIEALAKSGITGGCGSGNYCPDAPLTRGQMAVFLAKALGLQWP